MFSSLVKFVSTSLSPKAWLAKSLAKALNELFVLDDASSSIESNLLHDTKIVLRNATVRPRSLSATNTVLLSGVVEEVEFSWEWGSGTTGSSSFVKDVCLTIRGAKFRIVVGGDGGVDGLLQQQVDNNKQESSSSAFAATNSSNQKSGYVQQQIQQVVDHLTLHITDVSVRVEDYATHHQQPTHDTNNYGVLLQAKALQLVSFGRPSQQQQPQPQSQNNDVEDEEEGPPLSQRISLESISIVLESNNDDTTDHHHCLPLLDPIGYAASVKRVSGRRFMDGWMTGLEIVGELLLMSHVAADNASFNSGFVMHAGETQIATLGRLVNRLSTTTSLPAKQDSASAVLSSSLTSSATSPEESFYDCGDDGDDTASTTANEEKAAVSGAAPTTVLLPLPSIKVILSSSSNNDDDGSHSNTETDISIPHCTFLYHVGGTVSRLFGNQGIEIGGKPFLNFGAVGGGGDDTTENGSGEWMADFANLRVSLRQQQQQQQQQTLSSTIVAQIDWNDAILKQLVRVFGKVAAAVPGQLADQVETAIHDYSASTVVQDEAIRKEQNTKEAPTPTPSVWTFNADGIIALRVIMTGQGQQQQDWVQASIRSPFLQLDTNAATASQHSYMIHRLEVGGMEIGPTSFGTEKSSILRFPAMSLQEDEQEVHPKQCLVLDGAIEAILESKTVAYKLQNFGAALTNFPTAAEKLSAGSRPVSPTGRASGTSDHNVSSVLVSSFKCPAVKLRLEEEFLSASIQNVSMQVNAQNEIVIRSESMQCWLKNDTSQGQPALQEALSTRGIVVNLGGSTTVPTMKIQRIDTMQIPGYLDGLAEPVQNITLAFGSSSQGLQIDVCSPLRIVLPTSPISDNTVSSISANSGSPIAASTPIPFPLQVRLQELQVSVPSMNSTVCAQPLHFAVKSEEHDSIKTTSVQLNKEVSIRLDVQDQQEPSCRWLEASIAEKSALCLSDNFRPKFLQCDGVQLKGASCGRVNVDIPSFSFTNDAVPQLKSSGILSVDIQSAEVAKDLQNLVEQAIGACSAKNDQSVPGSPEPVTPSFDVYLHGAKVAIEEPFPTKILAQGIGCGSTEGDMTKCSISIEHPSFGPLSLLASPVTVKVSPDFRQANVLMSKASLEGKDGLVVSVSDANTVLEYPAIAQLALGRVDKLMVPEMFELLQPILGMTMSFDGAMINLNLVSIRGVCPLMSTNGQTRSSTNPSVTIAAGDKSPLPFPVHLKLDQLDLKASNESSTSLSVASVDLLMVPVGSEISIDTSVEIKARIADTESQKWIQGSFGPVSAVINPTSCSALPIQASCSYIGVGPSSFGQLDVNIPTIELRGGSAIECGDVSGEVESADLVEQSMALLEACFPSDMKAASSLTFSLVIPQITLSISASKTRAVAERVILKGTVQQVTCDRFGIQHAGGAAAAFSGLKAVLVPTLGVEIAKVDAFYLPGICSIEKPVQQVVKVAFEGEVLCIDMPPVDLIVFGSHAQQGGQNKDSGGGTEFEIPYPVRFSLQQVLVKSFTEGGEVTKLSHLAFHVKPQEQDPFALGNVPQAMMFHVVMSYMENKLLKVAKTSASGVVYCNDLSKIHRFRVTTEAVEMSVGFSTVDWSSIFGKQEDIEKSQPIALPLASVEAFVTHLNYKGKVVGVGKTAVSVPAFRGGPQTDSTELVNHLKKAILDRVPAMVTNVKVFGGSVTEMTAGAAGRAMLAATSATGCAAGSMVGLVAADSIRGSISMGKKSRGADAGDKYQFGDFSRGIRNSVSSAAKSGAVTRRGSSDSYALGDFTAGASSSAVEYAGQNKSRLGSAGGSGVGMVIGCAVAGPLGLVAGSLLGSKFGREAFEDKKAPADIGALPTADLQAQHNETSSRHPAGETDLIGLSAAPYVSPSSGYPQHAAQTNHPPPSQQHQQQQTGYYQDNPRSQHQQPHQPPPPQHHQPQQQQQQQQGYRFGDMTRSVIAKGKDKSGRDGSDSYKFGDFTRGLFK